MIKSQDVLEGGVIACQSDYLPPFMIAENPIERLHVSLARLQVNDRIDGFIGVGHHDRDHCVGYALGKETEWNMDRIMTM